MATQTIGLSCIIFSSLSTGHSIVHWIIRSLLISTRKRPTSTNSIKTIATYALTTLVPLHQGRVRSQQCFCLWRHTHLLMMWNTLFFIHNIEIWWKVLYIHNHFNWPVRRSIHLGYMQSILDKHMFVYMILPRFDECRICRMWLVCSFECLQCRGRYVSVFIWMSTVSW